MNEQPNIDNAVITCPKCQANYNVAASMLGDKGREVKCAKCEHRWKAVAIPSMPDILPDSVPDISSKEESEMDAGFEAAIEQERNSPPTQKNTAPDNLDESEAEALSPKALAQQEKDLARRNSLIAKAMPKARMTRVLRIMGAVLLAMVIASGLFLRENIVRTFPDLAGLYGAVGFGVNVVGLDFADVKTLRVLRDGDEVMDISAGIKSVSSAQVSVPRIIVTLLNENGASVFEWSVTSRAAIMLSGEWIDFETQLISPPEEATSVRLTFESLN